MKRFLLGLSQFILSAFLYTALGTVIIKVLGFIVKTISSIPIIGFLFMSRYMGVIIVSTFSPFILMIAISMILGTLYSWNFSYKVHLIFSIYVLLICIGGIMNSINNAGFFSFTTLAQLWSAILYVGIPMSVSIEELKENMRKNKWE